MYAGHKPKIKYGRSFQKNYTFRVKDKTQVASIRTRIPLAMFTKEKSKVDGTKETTKEGRKGNTRRSERRKRKKKKEWAVLKIEKQFT